MVVVLGFELRAWHLLGRCSAARAMFLVLFTWVCFSDRVSCFLPRLASDHNLLLSSWDYRHEPLCLAHLICSYFFAHCPLSLSTQKNINSNRERPISVLFTRTSSYLSSVAHGQCNKCLMKTTYNCSSFTFSPPHHFLGEGAGGAGGAYHNLQARACCFSLFGTLRTLVFCCCHYFSLLSGSFIL
jgi:hypothetical protein